MQFTIDTDLAIAGTFLGLAAIGLAIPPLLQMLFGRADFAFEADDFTGSEGRILVLAIRNEPVKGRVLRWMGVEREAADIIAFFGVQEHGTNKIIVHNATGLLQCPPLRQIGLQARALPGFSVGLVVVSTREGNASVVDARPEKVVPSIPDIMLRVLLFSEDSLPTGLINTSRSANWTTKQFGISERLAASAENRLHKQDNRWREPDPRPLAHSSRQSTNSSVSTLGINRL